MTAPTDVDEVTRAPTPRHPVRRVLAWIGRGVLVVVVLVVLVAAWPVSSGGLGARPDPAADHAEAVARFEALAGSEDDVFEPCRSQLLDHGQRTDRAVVLFHGLTNCPRQFVELAEQLYDSGANVLILRAPHHGLADETGTQIGGVGEVGGLTSGELRDYADTSIDLAAGLGDEVQVLGLSMGGVLAAWTAQARPEVDLAVVIAPAISIPRVPGAVTTAFVNLFSRVPNLSLPGVSNLDHAYAGESTRALTQMFRLGRWVQSDAEEQGPAAGRIVLVLNPNDDQVDNGDIRFLLARPWLSHGANLDVVELPPTPELPHDVIDVGQPSGDPELVYPILLELLGVDPV